MDDLVTYLACSEQLSLVTKRRIAISSQTRFPKISITKLEQLIISSLDDNKAEAVVSLNLTGKSDVADRMIVATGTSTRHVASLADSVVEALEAAGYEHIPVEGKETCEWVLVDAGDILVQLFKPEIRHHYNLEKMWSVPVSGVVEAGV